MKRLILLRHAKSSWDHPELSDFERPLNRRGARAARLMGTYIHRNGLEPDLILCSPATRTRETVAGLLEQVASEPEVRFVDDFYLADPEDILASVADVDDGVERVLCVGHNPGFQQTVLRLTTVDACGARDAIVGKFPTAALAVIDFDNGSWRDVARGTLVDYQTPKTLV